MIIDYISDLHEDHYIQNKKITDETITAFIKDMNPKGEILIVAGDTSETNRRLVKTLDSIQRLFNYEKIFFVLGNHELYGYDYKNWQEKVKGLKHLLRKYPNLIFLDGQIEEYKGIKIGGTMMWYDGSYAKKLGNSSYPLNDLWKRVMPDSQSIKGLNYFNDIFHNERKKLNKFYKNVDIIVSHISPLNEKKYIHPMFKEDYSSSFFCFDGWKYLEETSAKHWFYGHVHNPNEVKLENIELHCNPYGYRREAQRKIFKQISF